MLIKVTVMPAGEAPEWVRQAWVNMILRSEGESDSLAVGVLTQTPDPDQNLSHLVRLRDAIEALEDDGKSGAANWWKANVPVHSILKFGKQYAHVVSP